MNLDLQHDLQYDRKKRRYKAIEDHKAIQDYKSKAPQDHKRSYKTNNSFTFVRLGHNKTRFHKRVFKD